MKNLLTKEHKENIRLGMLKAYKEGRKKSHIKGKTYEEIYGIEKALEIKEGQSINGQKKHNMTKEGSLGISKAMSKRMKGNDTWNKGKTGIYSEETLKKMGKRLRGKTYEELYGEKRALKMKKEKSIISRKKWEDPEYCKKVGTRREISSLEQKLIDIILLHNLPYKFVGNFDFMIGKKFPDFIRTDNKKIAIEVYGSFYKLKGFKSIKEYENKRSAYFRRYGWETIFFHDSELNNQKYVLKNLIKKGGD